MGGALLVVLGLLGWLATLATGERSGPLGTVGYTVQPPAGLDGHQPDRHAPHRRRLRRARPTAARPSTACRSTPTSLAAMRPRAHRSAAVARMAATSWRALAAARSASPAPCRPRWTARRRCATTSARTARRCGRSASCRDGTYYVVTLTRREVGVRAASLQPGRRAALAGAGTQAGRRQVTRERRAAIVACSPRSTRPRRRSIASQTSTKRV